MSPERVNLIMISEHIPPLRAKASEPKEGGGSLHKTP
jgi:hypothetical protein